MTTVGVWVGSCANLRYITGESKIPREPRPILEALETRTLLSLSAPVSYNVGTLADGFVPNAAPINVVSADFNRDGKLDLVISHTADNSLYFLKGKGNGTFLPAAQIPIGEAIEGREFVGDFNRDGKLDIFLPGAAGQAIVMLGNGDGTFKPRIDSSSFAVTGYYPRGWTVGDFNGDGKLDVASTLPTNSSDSGRVTVLLGHGDGTFKAGIVSPVGLLHYSRWAAVGDFNHDGKADLAISDGQGSSGQINNVELTILFGNGNGTFHLGGHYTSPQFPDGNNTNVTANPEDVALADLNGDGNLDAIVSDYDNTINVFLGNRNGTFQAARSFAPGHYPRDVVAADVNHDGKKDLIVTNVGINLGGALFSQEGAEPGSVAVLLGDGKGNFQPPITYSPSAYPGWTAVGDFNRDGFPDIAVTQVFDGHSVKVMLNQPTSRNLPPTFVNSPRASADIVTGKTVRLSTLSTDDGGESHLTYKWATVGPVPAAVAFSNNGTNSAKNTTARFAAPGSHTFQVAVTDAAGLSIIDLVSVTVTQTLVSINLTPPTASVAVNGNKQFTAVSLDQFGSPMIPQPSLIWTVSGGGTITGMGLFTAGPTAGGPFTVTARGGTVIKTGKITVTGKSTGGSLTFYSLAGDGRVRYFGDPGIGLAQWNTVHNAASGNEADDLLPNRANWVGSGALFGPSPGNNGVDIMRGYLAFDTSALPANAVITSATLGVFVTGTLDSINDGNDFVTVVQGLQGSPTGLVPADYSRAGNAITKPMEGANRVDITGMTANGYVQWNLNAAGLRWIDRGGITQLAAREGHDLLNAWPNYASGQADVVSAYMSEQPGTLQDPFLQITYTIPTGK